MPGVERFSPPYPLHRGWEIGRNIVQRQRGALDAGCERTATKLVPELPEIVQAAAASRRELFQQAQHRQHAAEDRERLCEHRAGEAPRKASLKAGKLVAERLRCHVIAVLGGLPNGVRDRVGLLGGKASAGQPAGDGMGVEHQIRLSRALGWPYG